MTTDEKRPATRRRPICAAFMTALLTTFLAAFAWTAALAPARADTADFYKGKTLEVLVGFSAGGGYDLYARALARALGKYIPGNPTIVVKNMAGAGSLRLAMFLQDVAARDGLVMGTMDPGLLIESLLKPGGAGFDATKPTWIGSIVGNAYVCVTWAAGRFKTVDDLRKSDSAFGVTGHDDIRYMNMAILKNLQGARIKPVSGYPGSSDVRLALERGEIDGECDSWNSLKATKADWVKDKKINVVAQMTIDKHPDLPDLPLIVDLAKTPQEKAALQFLLAPQKSGRPFAAPPGIPADRAQALRQAFDASMNDPDFLAYAKQAELDVEPMTGQAVEALIAAAYKTPPESIAIARSAIQ